MSRPTAPFRWGTGELRSSFSSADTTLCDVYIGHSAFVFILPYVEGGNQYNVFNVTRPYNSVSNLTGMSVSVSSYLCPSDTAASQDPSGDITPAQASYGTVRGTYETTIFNWALAAYPDPAHPTTGPATGVVVTACSAPSRASGSQA